METKLQHVSDTALMVAAARARESLRSDRLTNDPFAAKLAGARGEEILAEMQTPTWICFGMGLRTKFIDETLLYEIGTRDINCAINLGAGLDTRPWRLNLIPSLRWIEVDFPAILDYKHETLAAHSPRCRLERMSADLNDAAARNRIWDAIADEKHALLITEGLLMYLPADTVHALAKESYKAAIASWILDFNSRALMRAAHGAHASKIDNLRDPNHLEPESIRQSLSENGWRQADEKRFVRDGGRYGYARMQAEGIQPPSEARISDDDPGGIALFHKKR